MNDKPPTQSELATGSNASARQGTGGRTPEFILSLILLGFVLAISAAGWGYYKRQEVAVESSAENELRAVVDLRVSQIVQWRQERRADANMIRDTLLLSSTAQEVLEDPANRKAARLVLDWMESFRRHGGCARMVLLDSNLQVRLAAPEKENWIGPLAADFARAALRTNQVLISDLHISRVSSNANMDYFVPVLGAASASDPRLSVAGVFMLEVDPKDFLFPSIQAWPTPSRTGETLLVRREGDDAVYLNELRHRKNTALKLRLSIAKHPNLPAAVAARGQEGVVYGLDYRQQPVLAITRRVPDSPWAIVAKRDQIEIYASLRKRGWIIGALIAALILAATLGIRLVWRNREYRFSLQELEDRKQAEEALRQSAERFRGFTAATFEGICVSEQGQILDMNDQFAALFGYNRAELIGREIITLIAPESRATVAEAIRTGREAAYEHQVSRKDGSVFQAEGRAKVSYRDGRRVRVTALRDITQRKWAEAERERLLREVVRKNKELESVIYVSSHDLRSPLVNIQGFSHRLQTACDELQRLLGSPEPPPSMQAKVASILQDRIAPSLNFILTSVLKMDALLTGLLRLSRLGRSALRLETLDMNRLARTAGESMAFQIQQAGARLEIDELPSCHADATQLSQVFTNLLDNALKYRAPERPLVMRIRGEVRGGETIYCVEDNGLGIPPESHEKIWEVFQRLDPAGPAKGDGLGLTIVRRILDQHDGRAWVESDPGRGSRFFVALPAVPAGDLSLQRAKQPHNSP